MEMPLIPKAYNLEVHTGNIVNWNRLKRRPNVSPTMEIAECISTTIQSYLRNSDKTDLQYQTKLICSDSEKCFINKEDRAELKVIAKIFICSSQPPLVISEIVTKVMDDLGIVFVETVLLSISLCEAEEEVPVERLLPYWLVLEDMVVAEKVMSIGIADLDKKKLEHLCEMAQVKPQVNQVNLASCCTMPEDLTVFAKQADIQLQTHDDPPEILPDQCLQDAMQGSWTKEQDLFGWQAEWVVRFSVMVTGRGIISSKGYIMKANRDQHRRM